MSEKQSETNASTTNTGPTPRASDPLPTVSEERRRELLERGRDVRRRIQERFKPLLEVGEAKLNRRLS